MMDVTVLETLENPSYRRKSYKLLQSYDECVTNNSALQTEVAEITAEELGILEELAYLSELMLKLNERTAYDTQISTDLAEVEQSTDYDSEEDDNEIDFGTKVSPLHHVSQDHMDLNIENVKDSSDIKANDKSDLRLEKCQKSEGKSNDELKYRRIRKIARKINSKSVSSLLMKDLIYLTTFIEDRIFLEQLEAPKEARSNLSSSFQVASSNGSAPSRRDTGLKNTSNADTNRSRKSEQSSSRKRHIDSPKDQETLSRSKKSKKD